MGFLLRYQIYLTRAQIYLTRAQIYCSLSSKFAHNRHSQLECHTGLGNGPNFVVHTLPTTALDHKLFFEGFIFKLEMNKIFCLLLGFPRSTHFRDQNDQGIQPINFTNEQKEASGDKLLHFLFNSTGLSFLPHLPQDGFFIVYLWKWGNVMPIKYVTPT